jgi:hypothetical protein
MSDRSGAASTSEAPCCCHQPAAALHSCAVSSSTGGTPRSALNASRRGLVPLLLLLLLDASLAATAAAKLGSGAAKHLRAGGHVHTPTTTQLNCAWHAHRKPAERRRQRQQQQQGTAHLGSWGCGPATASRPRAKSCAVRASMPLTPCSRQCGSALSCSCCIARGSHACGTTPTLGLMPTTLQYAAGLRRLPPRSVPVASHTF